MKKYSDEFKEHALRILREKGYKKASSELHVHKETLYRWKREAGIVLTNHRRKYPVEENMESELKPITHPEVDPDITMLDEADVADEEDFFAEDTSLPRLYPRRDEIREEDFELLMAANEKLRKRNAHLRKVINVLLDS